MPQVQRLLDDETFRGEAHAGRAQDAGLFKFSTAEPEVKDSATRTVKFVFSDGSTDLAGDRISPDGWDLAQYRKNSVVLWAHQADQPPIGKAAGVVVRGAQLVGDISFAPPEIYEFGDLIYRLVRGKYLNAVSVGFMPIKYSFSTDPNRPLGLDFKTQKLLEVSLCPIPCNGNALAEARASGIDTRALVSWAEAVLDRGDSPLPRRDLESLRRLAAEPRSRRIQRSAEVDGLNRVIDDLNSQVYAGRQTAKDIKALIPTAPDPTVGPAEPPPFDTGLAEQAMGHVREATSRQTRAMDCIRQAIARAPDTPDPLSPSKRRGHDLSTQAGRVADAQEVREIIARQEEARRITRGLR